ETYVEQILGALHLQGHDVGLWYEVEEPSGAAPIVLPAGVRSRQLTASGEDGAWNPDAIVVNGLQDVDLEAALLARFPALYVAHNFYGTCISGRKSWSAPVERPCVRRFGAACLVHYFPHRCGGLNPFTMLSMYQREHRRLTHLGAADCIVTLS